MRLLFLLPRLNIAGGVYIVAKMAEVLARTGRHDVALAVWDLESLTGARWLRVPDAVPIMPFPEAARGVYDVVFATWWETLLGLPQFEARTYAHFVLALESAFFPWGDPRQPLHEYLLGSDAFPSIVTARWLLNYASRPAYCVLAGLDRALFRPTAPVIAKRPGTVRFLVEGPMSAARKNVRHTVDVLEQLGCEYVVVGEDASKAALGRHCIGVFCVPLPSMAAVYSSADVLVKCSSSEGMFAPPLEMFACGGTAICWDVWGSEEYMAHGYNSLLPPMNNFSTLTGHVERLASDRAFLEELKANARATAEGWPSWAEIASPLEAAVEKVAEIENRTQFRDVIERARERFRWSPPADPPSVTGRL